MPARALKTLALLALAFSLAGLGGCSLLKREPDKEAKAAQGQPPAEGPPRYELRVEAPDRDLRSLLADNLDLQRFRRVRAEDGLNDEEIDRLVALAPDQAKAMLATEGYFTPTVRAEKHAAEGGALPVIVVQVEPGPRTHVDDVSLNIEGAVQRNAQAGDRKDQRLLRQLRSDWALKPGDAFRQEDWTSAKNAALAALHADGYPGAAWADTQALVRKQQQTASLAARADSGPLFHVGPTRIEGLQRYGEPAVRNLADFPEGTRFSEKLLLDYQDRLRQSGLFEGAVVEMDTDPEHADAAPVTVRVRENKLQNATFGVGYSSDTGNRLTLEHVHRRPFGFDWVARNNFAYGSDRKAWEFDLRSHPLPRLWQNLVSGNVERLRSTDEDRTSARLRVGRTQTRDRLERLYYLEAQHSRVEQPLPLGVQRAQSLAANADWTWRDVDSRLLPRRGQALLLQTGAGYARSSTADSGPFARTYGRLLVYRPFAKTWLSRLRLELGQVFAADAVGVPDPLLFRAGGEDSVRGYAYRSLGPKVAGVVTSGRSLFTASAEVAHPLLPRVPALLGEVFVDAGNAAENFSKIKPVVGVGAGVQYRSPVGPLRVDLAYGLDAHRFRLHVSAGVNF